jgi:hypothetical protein
VLWCVIAGGGGGGRGRGSKLQGVYGIAEIQVEVTIDREFRIYSRENNAWEWEIKGEGVWGSRDLSTLLPGRIIVWGQPTIRDRKRIGLLFSCYTHFSAAVQEMFRTLPGILWQ